MPSMFIVKGVMDAIDEHAKNSNQLNEDGSYTIHIGLGHKKDLVVKGDTLTQNDRTIFFQDLDRVEHGWSTGTVKLFMKSGELFCKFDDLCKNRTLFAEDVRKRNITLVENRQAWMNDKEERNL
ncbi:MAG: hypothetical protein IKF70_02655 [Firmicutes bacterium]|nr:hypothetical protein [Bacillota bacterium]